MELVVKTYFKQQSIGQNFKNSEFGVDHPFSPEAYLKYLELIHQNHQENEIFNEKNSHLLIKPVLEEVLISRPSSPEGSREKIKVLAGEKHSKTEKKIRELTLRKKIESDKEKFEISSIIKRGLSKQILNSTRN